MHVQIFKIIPLPRSSWYSSISSDMWFTYFIHPRPVIPLISAPNKPCVSVNANFNIESFVSGISVEIWTSILLSEIDTIKMSLDHLLNNIM